MAKPQYTHLSWHLKPDWFSKCPLSKQTLVNGLTNSCGVTRQQRSCTGTFYCGKPGTQGTGRHTAPAEDVLKNRLQASQELLNFQRSCLQKSAPQEVRAPFAPGCLLFQRKVRLLQAFFFLSFFFFFFNIFQLLRDFASLQGVYEKLRCALA